MSVPLAQGFGTVLAEVARPNAAAHLPAGMPGCIAAEDVAAG